MNISTWLPIRNSMWLFRTVLLDALEVDEGAVGGAQVAEDRVRRR